MKKCIGVLGSLVLGLSGAAHAETSYSYADVVEATPLYRVVEVSVPREQCWEEEIAIDRYPAANQSNTPVLVSTILGGAIGNALGHNKSNRRVGTVVGAVLGHSIGRDIMRQSRGPEVREYETVQRCETVYESLEEERLTGYRVTYLYNGEEHTVRTQTDPGDQIRVRVNVEPVL